MADDVHRVATACGLCYHSGRPCNQFVQDVAPKLGIALPVVQRSAKLMISLQLFVSTWPH